jgi:hypothetical protein
MSEKSGLIPPKKTFQDLILRALLELGATDGDTASRHHVMAKATELGRFSDAQLAVPPPPRNRGGFKSWIAYELSFALSDLKDAGWITNPRRGMWTLLEGGEQAARRISG